VVLLAVRFTTFLGFGTYDTPLISAGNALLIVIPQRVVHQTLVGKGRSPLTSPYSALCVEGRFSEIRSALQDVLERSERGLQGST
jgi:hypothetical protein